MKRHVISVILLIIFFASCNTSQKQNSETTNTTNKAGEAAGCYIYSKDSNNVRMHITQTGNAVTGDLVYEYFEKDKNTGTIKGEMKGDTLYADYSFMSEGTNSVREVAFLKRGNEWIEGYGEVDEETGKIVFKNKAALKFDNSIKLTKTSCNE